MSLSKVLKDPMIWTSLPLNYDSITPAPLPSCLSWIILDIPCFSKGLGTLFLVWRTLLLGISMMSL